MIDRLLSLFKEHEPEKDEHDISLACAALLAEVMHADHTLEKEEVAALRQALQDLFRITSAETDALLAQAADQVQKSNDLFQFTKVINDGSLDLFKCSKGSISSSSIILNIF